MRQIVIHNVEFSADEFINRIAEILSDKVSQAIPKEEKPTNYLSRKETAKLLKISLPTLDKYLKEGYLKSYRIGNKIRLKEDEVETAMEEVMSMKYKRAQ